MHGLCLAKCLAEVYKMKKDQGLVRHWESHLVIYTRLKGVMGFEEVGGRKFDRQGVRALREEGRGYASRVWNCKRAQYYSDMLWPEKKDVHRAIPSDNGDRGIFHSILKGSSRLFRVVIPFNHL